LVEAIALEPGGEGVAAEVAAWRRWGELPLPRMATCPMDKLQGTLDDSLLGSIERRDLSDVGSEEAEPLSAMEPENEPAQRP
jgi:hypothetical protein